MIDQKIIDAHQWIVDESERKPAWWVEQTAWAYIAADLTAVALAWDSGWDILVAAIGLALGAVLILTSRSDALMASAAAQWVSLRVMLVALTVYYTVRLVIAPEVGRAAHLLALVVLTSCHYFAACQPPRPRKRRQSVARGAA